MAEAPRRKKLEKTVDDSTTIQTSQKFYCCRCGTSYSRKKGYFPVSHSPMYRGSGFLPMCNDCVEDMYEQYRAMLGDDKAAMKRMCMKLDLYWNEDIYAMVERTAGVHSRVRNYIGKTNIIRYIDKTFDDTLDEEALLEPEETPAASYIAQTLTKPLLISGVPVILQTFTLSWNVATRIGLATGKSLTQVSVHCTARFVCLNPLSHATAHRVNQLIRMSTRLILCLAV